MKKQNKDKRNKSVVQLIVFPPSGEITLRTSKNILNVLKKLSSPKQTSK